jgi:hypothetical protein
MYFRSIRQACLMVRIALAPFAALLEKAGASLRVWRFRRAFA